MPSLCHREKTCAPSVWRWAISASVHKIPHLRRKTPAMYTGLDESDHSPLQGGGESLSCAIALLRTHAKEKTEQSCSPQEVCRFIHMPRASAKWEHLASSKS